MSDLLGTTRSAGARFRTLDLAAVASHDAAALARLMAHTAEAHRRTHGPGSARPIRASGQTSSDNGRAHHTWRVWWAPPTLWRDDLTWPNGQTTVIIVRPDAAQAYVSMQGALYTSAAPAREGAQQLDGMHLPTIADRLAEFPLIRPPLPASEWEFATLGEERYLGRVTRRVRATRRADPFPAELSEASGYWPGVDEYECLVDDALQILLSFTGIADGAAVASIYAEDVHVDVPHPTDVFTFTPPAGTRIMHVAVPG